MAPVSHEQNVELLREVVRYAHERGVGVEGELGVLAGVEDDVFSRHLHLYKSDAGFVISSAKPVWIASRSPMAPCTEPTKARM